MNAACIKYELARLTRSLARSNQVVSEKQDRCFPSLVLGEKFALEEALERVRTHAGSDVLPLGKQTAFDMAAGKKWKKEKKKKKKKTARFLLVPRNAQKSYNVRIRRKIS